MRAEGAGCSVLASKIRMRFVQSGVNNWSRHSDVARERDTWGVGLVLDLAGCTVVRGWHA